MTIESPPLWLQGGTYPARMDRLALAEMREEGVGSAIACKVTPRSSGANMTVDIAVGGFWITGDDQALQGLYQGRVTAAETAVPVSNPPAGTDQRYDIVVLRVNDPNAGSGNTPANTVSPVVIAGAASPTPAVPALPNSCLPLAVLGPITSGTPSITAGMIHDVWTGTGPAFAQVCRLLAGDRVPVAEMRLRAANPDRVNGWLWCNGQPVSRTTYAALFAEIGTGFGAGNGSTTFNLPDLRDKVPVAKGTSFPAVGAVGGELAHVMTVAEMPSHDHGYWTGVANADHSHYFNTGNESADHAHSFQVVTDTQGDHNHYSSGNPAVNLLGAVADSEQVLTLNNPANGPGISYNQMTSVQGAHAHNVGGWTSGRSAAHYHSGNTGGISANHQHGISAQGSGNAHNIMSPYQVMGGWMIKAT